MLTHDDVHLMLRFQQSGDCAAFNEIFRRHKDMLLRFVLRLAGNRSVAEDVSQQTWLKVVDVARRRGYSHRPGVALRTWLCSLARNHFIDEHRRKFAATRVVSLPDDSHAQGMLRDEHAIDPADLIHRRELDRHVNRALRELPFEQREVIALWAAGVDLESMVAMIGAPRNTILSRKKYAIAKLRVALHAATGEMLGGQPEPA